MDPSWIKIKSWHVVKTATRAPGRYVTICGRGADGQTLPDRPGHEATCESCLRIISPK